MSMFCYQCEQTARGTGCTVAGVCGKDATTSNLQDLLIFGLKGLSMYAHRAHLLGVRDDEIDRFTVEALFSTVTNVNFDPERLVSLLHRLAQLKERARTSYEQACSAQGRTPETLDGPAAWIPASTLEGLEAQAAEAGIARRKAVRGDTLAGLEWLIMYGLKGMAAYADHALILGQRDPDVFSFFHETLDFLTRDHDADTLLAKALDVGRVNLRVMELLDAANTGAYGHPVPTRVRITPVKGKAIVVSGHDLKDLEEVLKQTEGLGINVYTHGEMLPAHGYPGLKRYGHLVGNYGGAWQNQQRDFDAFPGAILMTTNCLQKPRESYKSRIFTSGLVAWPGVVHIPDRNFAPLIAAAQASHGFASDEPERTVMVGFGHQAVLGLADKVVDAVRRGAIRHFFLVGGCDGAKPGRDYYTRFVEQTPPDTVVLTLACGKYRFHTMELGTIDGIPRLMDVGQCNDAYSAIMIAKALAEAFGTDVNGLPLSLVLSWYEQKAVAILLTLLSLGIKSIRLGPSLPAFVATPVLQALVDTFGLAPITTPEEDMAALLR